ncbi:nuclear transport factor 2 family protein [Stakelama marina]|uniref:Nuclear transport factor 2 family protein n=1 Tax=Stakelama marina TaxID=2826939 RepID=A0A8T4IGI0_9SPHN|nr:nuclear transport factor 2 family protein [Stakelama marina]MBR0551369.1 nuclear transport factor 2 family protein [Stakelama marina]
MPLSLLLAGLLQTTPVPPLPPANPGPPPTPDVAAVMQPIDAMFAGLAAHDAAAIRAQVRPEGGATVAIEKPDGTKQIRHLGWDEFTAGIKPGPEKYEERLINPAVEVDGDIAMVWGNYVFLVDGKVQHCGVDHFDLVRENGAWKVLNVTWSQRTTGCPAGGDDGA